ncbi:DUF2642 domain-containing protein [Paenibacillus sp. ACRSA]|uniref:DUF2642 domain-containing protein n=1 Tax=Paenibacillus sp. ACRSA TaxID=2918211 RepID=UPI001EF6C1D7|nr:DUF2642 domain-containing protein [Paenibacillus sp. ACRSA]MCG7377761.1 DUF2642 domain-containing protein [Paenibacillus sp. ACRSA]
MDLVTHWLGKSIELELSGCKLPIQGEIIDVGQDLIVVYENNRFVYVPLHHIQTMHANASDLSVVIPKPDPEIDHDNISYRKMLMNARGRFSEISIAGRKLHGYITNIMNDYFMFYSPLYHSSLYVSINHLKYIIPSPTNSTPYSLSQQHFPIQPSSMSLSRTFDQQLHKMIGQLVIINLDCKPYHAGVLKTINGHLLALVEAEGTSLIMHTDHIQTIHLP